ncbi:MAG: pentapeptide repeat-containing protein [Myxococcales bacterium]|nr:pentapeptide repeat-containing protein [Myxococcales bacterium]
MFRLWRARLREGVPAKSWGRALPMAETSVYPPLMSDLNQIANARDFVQQLRTGRMHRVEVAPCDLGQHGGTEFGPASWNHVRMTGTKLVGLWIRDLKVDRWFARGVLLNGTRFEGAQLSSVSISNSQAMALQWPKAVLQGCRFSETALTNANLSRAALTGCHFDISDLNHTNLTEALLLNCRFTDSRQGGAVVDNVNLSGAVLCGVDLRGAGLFRANFDGAVLVDVDLRDANLVDANFRNAVMIGCKTDRADMSGETERQVRNAAGGIADITRTLLAHHEPAQLAMITAAVLAAMADLERPAAAASPAAAATTGDPVAELVQLQFPTLIRELQGRGGPTELGRLRVEGDHVYARGIDGNEVRLTAQERSAPVRPPVMRDPKPAPATPRPAAPAPPDPAPAAPPSYGDFDAAGLEID